MGRVTVNGDLIATKPARQLPEQPPSARQEFFSINFKEHCDRPSTKSCDCLKPAKSMWPASDSTTSSRELSWVDISSSSAVVLSGAPNVGKSSLINALVGYERAIVFAEPGTTRDVVTAGTAVDGWPIELADTAGLRESTDPLEAAGIALCGKRSRPRTWCCWCSI